MAHKEQIDFCVEVRTKFPEYFERKLVLDIGALDINGNNAYLFENCSILTVDIAEGRNVDIVAKAHELALPDNTFDTVLSTECFEHDQHYEKSVINLFRMLKPGGLFFFSCATTGRPEHGTLRTSPSDAPLLSQYGNEWGNYYKNLTATDFESLPGFISGFKKHWFGVNERSQDLYFWGLKAGEFKPRMDYSFLIPTGQLNVTQPILTLSVILNGTTESDSNQISLALHSESPGLNSCTLPIAYSDSIKGPEALVIAFGSHHGIVTLDAISIIDETGTVKWDLGSLTQIGGSQGVRMREIPGATESRRSIEVTCLDNTPSITIPIPENQLEIKGGYRLEIASRLGKNKNLEDFRRFASEELLHQQQMHQQSQETNQRLASELAIATAQRTKLTFDIEHLASNLGNANQAILNQAEDIRKRTLEYATLRTNLSALENQIVAMKQSWSWRISQPLRSASSYAFLIIRRLLKIPSVAKITVQIWRASPLPPNVKLKVRRKFAPRIGSLLNISVHGSSSLRPEVLTQEVEATFSKSPNMPRSISLSRAAHPVERRKSNDFIHAAGKVICFYLPQFHPIPENNEWWGEGFTEWTNVKPSQPRFKGHDQPRVPGELGYYDLRDASTMINQISLAKQYGVGGFCFYVYWFGGKTLLENPVESFLADKQFDIEFCLCWANENWSRRWDGLDQELLIAQHHSDEDDQAFIEHYARFLMDIRCIRVDGKPLLLVYRPSLLPNPKATAERWRNWCRDHGIGEIHLCYPQSFERVDPKEYGFDSAVEFPPNNASPDELTELVEWSGDNFGSKVYDLASVAKRSAMYSDPGYPLYRSACPSWDNSARKKKNASIFVNSSPALFKSWLQNALTYGLQKRGLSVEQNLVFVNAWNEWAEGAYLEPDQTHNFAHLDAVLNAQLGSLCQIESHRPLVEPAVCFVVHAFYPEIFAEIAKLLETVHLGTKTVFVSCLKEHRDLIVRQMKDANLSGEVIVVKNHGRDILPFLHILKSHVVGNFDIVVKLHTKKSTHREDGDQWRSALYSDLITPTSFSKAISEISKTGIGLYCPQNNLVPMGFYWGSNALRVLKLAARLGLDAEAVESLSFPAGTMFAARVSGLRPLLGLELSDSDFESESGQIDGTLAHAVERLIAVSMHSVNLRIISSSGVVQEFAHAARSN